MQAKINLRFGLNEKRLGESLQVSIMFLYAIILVFRSGGRGEIATRYFTAFATSHGS